MLRDIAGTVVHMMRPEAHPAYAAAREVLAKYLYRDILEMIRGYLSYQPQRFHARSHLNITKLLPAEIERLGFPAGIYMYIDDLLVAIGTARVMTYNRHTHMTCIWNAPGKPAYEWYFVGHGRLLGRDRSPLQITASKYLYSLHIDAVGTISEHPWLPASTLGMAHVLPCGLVVGRVLDGSYSDVTLLLDWRTIPPRIESASNQHLGWTCNDFGEDKTSPRFAPKYLTCKFSISDADRL